ncbi:hypothetical protein Amsp01_031300 [Amycolatopsis sp. NBRC 101858]|uniref:hypothetical protein n=1 Tax=Amycolatopsis sp. NBRC 101858 TaxID=3032200 RepID=UPI0024A3691C|nr:hypothetical protein [Amycolatopsis sp. NBRC 101858]GLY37106.1 hypothetical protein Amsp01_031300 [Amycolatopsis sp. NBRC 101858]
MRLGSLVLAVTATLALSACGPPDPLPSTAALLDEYARSTSVKNDRFTGTGSSAERAQYLFANYPGGRLFGALLATFRCGAGDQHGPFPSDKCDLTDEVRRTVSTVAGGDLYARSLLVKHERGSLELVMLYVVRGPGKSVAVDRTGRGYTDLADFRAHNDLLTAEDLVLTPADITAVPGGNAVVVTGHTPPAWPWWVLGGCVALVLVLTAVFVLLRRRAKARFDGLFGPGAT